MVDYNARKASTLPVETTVDAADQILIVADGAPPDLKLTTINALATLAGTFAPQGATGPTGATGLTGPAGKDLAVKGSVPTSAALPTSGVASGDTYVTANDGKLYVYDSGLALRTRTVTNVALTSNVATITVSAAHTMRVGETITVAGATPTLFNGSYAITTTPSATTFTYAKTNANVTSVASAGTVTAPVIAASWTAIATAVGPKGDTGATGPQGPIGTTGPQGVQGPAGVGIAGANVPVGTVLDFVGVTAPAGFLLCDGTEYPQATYPQLAALLVGSQWQQAVTVGYFKTPNLNGKTTVSIDPADAYFGVVGKTGGDKNAVAIDHNHPAGTLAMQNHSHPVNIWSSYYDINHLHGPGTLATNTTGQHGHNLGDGSAMWYLMPEGNVGYIASGGGRSNIGIWAHDGNHNHAVNAGTTAAMDRTGDHRHAINGNSDPAGGSVTGNTSNVGVAGTNRNVQPFAVMTKIIRATV